MAKTLLILITHSVTCVSRLATDNCRKQSLARPKSIIRHLEWSRFLISSASPSYNYPLRRQPFLQIELWGFIWLNVFMHPEAPTWLANLWCGSDHTVRLESIVHAFVFLSFDRVRLHWTNIDWVAISSVDGAFCRLFSITAIALSGQLVYIYRMLCTRKTKLWILSRVLSTLMREVVLIYCFFLGKERLFKFTSDLSRFCPVLSIRWLKFSITASSS